jgi:hypothetical protein
LSKTHPTAFFAPLPGLWQLSFWGLLALITLVAGWPLVDSNEPNYRGAFVMLVCFTFFVWCSLSTWFERRIRSGSAIQVDGDGLLFWPGSVREVLLPWTELDQIWATSGSNPEIVFHPKDLKKYGKHLFLFLRVGHSVPLKTAAKDGTLLSSVINELWEHHDAQHQQSKLSSS